MPDSVGDPVADAAREWLTRVIDMYRGIDAGGADPVHEALAKAQEFLDAGPTRSDPFVVAGMLAKALPGDERAAALADYWSETYVEAVQKDRSVRKRGRTPRA